MKEINYLIHMSPTREWFVNEFLIPSMIEQGIDKDKIFTYNDTNSDGNLPSFLFSSQRYFDQDLWHLQDDVVLSRDFAKNTQKYYAKVVCGFCNEYSRDVPRGYVHPDKMWFSFQCIFICKEIMQDFLNWCEVYASKSPKYRKFFNRKKSDDMLFTLFLRDKHMDVKILNLAPNLVDHIDYLLGGSIINKERSINTRSIYFPEGKVITELEKKLNERSKLLL